MLGTYRVEQKLAEGGMGSVFLATAPDGTKVVLKVPHAQDREAAIALADEARTGARLRHPAIVETLDFFVDKGVSVLVVAHIDGPSLYDLRRAGPLPASAVAEVGIQMASALFAIHTACDDNGRPLRMLHRDISPNNVLVDGTGQVRLIDLGIARSAERKQKQTSAGMVKGTLRYLSPEILRGGDHDVASDLWALGLTLWEALMGRYAIAGDPMNTMRAAMDGSILNLEPGERVDSDVLDTIAAFVCPAERRIQNARAAGAVLTRLANRRPGGRDALAEAVAVVRTAVFEDERTDNIDIAGSWRDPTSAAPPLRTPELPEATAVLAREEDVAGVFTSNMAREQIAAQVKLSPPRLATQPKPVGEPPGSSIPSVDMGDVFSVASMEAPSLSVPQGAPRAGSAERPARVEPRAATVVRAAPDASQPIQKQPKEAAPVQPLATASTLLQLPASQLSSTSEVHAAPATLPQMPRFASEDASVADSAASAPADLSDAPTLLAIPASQIPSMSPLQRTATPRSAPAPVSAIGPTLVQMPAANNVQSAPLLPNIHAAPTLQMPIVAAPAAAPSEVGPKETEQRPSKVSKTDEDNIETMRTIQMPQWVEPTGNTPGPKPSLMIPIVVVEPADDDE